MKFVIQRQKTEPGSKPEFGIAGRNDDDLEKYIHCVLVISDPEK